MLSCRPRVGRPRQQPALLVVIGCCAATWLVLVSARLLHWTAQHTDDVGGEVVRQSTLGSVREPIILKRATWGFVNTIVDPEVTPLPPPPSPPPSTRTSSVQTVEHAVLYEYGPDAKILLSGDCLRFSYPKGAPPYGTLPAAAFSSYSKRRDLRMTMREWFKEKKSRRKGGEWLEVQSDDDAAGGKRKGRLEKFLQTNSIGRTVKTAAPRAVVLTLTSNSAVGKLVRMLDSYMEMVGVKYPHIFLNDKDFSPQVQTTVSRLLCGVSATFVRIPSHHWGYPPTLDVAAYQATLTRLTTNRTTSWVPHIGSTSYRKMCRWWAGFFYKHPALQGYDYFWRVDDDIVFLRPVVADPIQEVAAADAVYGFGMAVWEITEAVVGLDESVSGFERGLGTGGWSRPVFRTKSGALTGCHFWNNLFVGSFAFFRSSSYATFFDHIDASSGQFYHRWGDAPLHTLAVSLLAPASRVVHLEGVSYGHDQFYHISHQAPSDNTVPRNGTGSHEGRSASMSCVPSILAALSQ